MYLRKLQALGFHSPNSNFNEEKDYRNLICWLEEQKINQLKADERTPLRDICSGAWEENVTKYLKNLGCDKDIKDKNFIINFLLNLSLRLEYNNKKNKIPLPFSSSISSSDPFQDMDFSSDEFKRGVSQLAQTLQISPHQDPLVLLKAIIILVKERLTKEGIENLKKLNLEQSKSITLDEVNLGFETRDLISKESGKILRLLYLRELRNLQDEANEAIVSAQSITANPKTDTKLGKVGY